MSFRENYLRSIDLVGAPVGGYTDKATVQRFQSAILSLPADKKNVPEFVALQAAINTQTNAFGVFGPTTKAAAQRFNALYGWNDGAIISDGTLAAMQRPDVQSGAPLVALPSQLSPLDPYAGMPAAASAAAAARPAATVVPAARVAQAPTAAPVPLDAPTLHQLDLSDLVQRTFEAAAPRPAMPAPAHINDVDAARGSLSTLQIGLLMGGSVLALGALSLIGYRWLFRGVVSAARGA